MSKYTPEQLTKMALHWQIADQFGDPRAEELVREVAVRAGMSRADVRNNLTKMVV